MKTKTMQLVGGEFVMDMTSITDTDITNEMMNGKNIIFNRK